MAAGEALMAGGIITTDSPHHSPKGLQIGVTVAECAGLGRAAWSVVLGIKEQNQGFAGQLVAAALSAVLIGQGDQGGLVSNSNCQGLIPITVESP